MQFIAIAALLAASLTHAQTVPGNAPGCVKYCLRVAREQTPSACTWAGWCGTSGFQESVTNCYGNICGPTNRQVGIQIYQQICSSAGSNTECPSATAASSSSSTLSTASTSSTSSTSSGSETSTTSELVTTTIGSATTTIPASATSSLASEASTSSEGASSSIESIQSSLSSAVSTATAPVSSAISSILASASSVAASASTATNPASQTANAATAIGLPTSGQLVSVGMMVLGVAAGAIML